MYWWLLLFAVLAGLGSVIWQVIKSKQSKKNILEQIQTDTRLKNAKFFEGATGYFILISESGYVGFKTPEMEAQKIVYINDINGFELQQNGHSSANSTAAIAGGLLFGGIGAVLGGIGSAKQNITSLSFVFKINDFNTPSIEIKFIDSAIKNDSTYYEMLMKRINELDGLLSFIEKKYRP